MAQQLDGGNDPFSHSIDKIRASVSSRKPSAKAGEWEEKFLGAIMCGATVEKAAAQAGVEETTPYRLRMRNEAFRKAWIEASEIGTELLEAEAQRRAYHGVLEPVFYKGVVCGHVRKYSDSMLMRLLAARKPEVYRDVGEESGRAPLTVSINVAVDNNPPVPPPPELVIVVDENSREEDSCLPETRQIPSE